jgi:hypothetical protein
MSQTLFAGPCRFCLATNYSLSSCGETVCPRCDTALSIAGPQPVGVTADQYRMLILEIGSIIGVFPQHQGEKFPGYKMRITLAVHVHRERRPFPESLQNPLSPEMQKSLAAGNNLSHVLAIATAKRAPPPPTEKTEVRKAREAAKKDRDRAAPLKLWN